VDIISGKIFGGKNFLAAGGENRGELRGIFAVKHSGGENRGNAEKNPEIEKKQRGGK